MDFDQDLMRAAFNVAHDYKGGAAQLALDIGRNPTTFSHEISETGAAKLGLKTAAKMTQRTRDLRILIAFAAQNNQMLVPVPASLDQTADECMKAMSNMSREFGELCQEICGSLGDDGEITDNELDRITKEAGQMQAAIHQMVATAQARNHRLHARQVRPT